MDMTQEEIEKELAEFNEEEKKRKKPQLITVSGIYVCQNSSCKLWISAVHRRAKLKDVAEKFNCSWEKLLCVGLNANFMTRRLWFKPKELVTLFNISGHRLVRDLKIGDRQISDWDLSPGERKLLFGSIDHYSTENQDVSEATETCENIRNTQETTYNDKNTTYIPMTLNLTSA